MKQWMKKSLAACLALVMCLTLAACGGKEGETPAEESVNVRGGALKGHGHGEADERLCSCGGSVGG